jgi:rfaE bifunctional protein kinase chain/domain
MAEVVKLRAQPTLLQISHLFPKRRIVVVGDLVADHYIYGQTDRVSREAPVLIVRYESSEVKLGAAGNAAANIRSLGGQVAAVGLLGQDEMGRELRRQFRVTGIRLHAPAPKGMETETKIRILAGGTNTTRQQMLRLDRGRHGPQLPRRRAEVAKLLEEAARGADAIVVSDYGGGTVGEECRAALRRLAADGMLVCVDSRYQLREFTGMTVCKPNEPELQALTRAPVESERDLIRAGKAAVRAMACRALLVTRGRHGMALFHRDGNVDLIPVYGAKEAVDVTGAGDTVIAAFTLALSAGGNLIAAAQIANIAGSLVVQKQGTATVPRAELLRELSEGAS